MSRLSFEDERAPGQVQATDDSTAKRPVAGSIRLAGPLNPDGITTPHSSKFRAATTVLVLVAMVAVVIAVSAAHNATGTGSSAPWSSWKPPDGGVEGAKDIANHIAPLYRISGADQLAAVTVKSAGGSSSASSGTTSNQLQVALNQTGTTHPTSSSVQLIGGKTIVYNLCGLGTSNCTIGQGSPSGNRMLLLRREGLELALYTLKYIKGITNVVATLPPGYTQQTGTISPTPPPSSSQSGGPTPVNLSVVFNQQGIQPFLSTPLSATLNTLPPEVPQLPQWRNTQEAGLVDQLTARALFSYKYELPADGSYLLVLAPSTPS